MVPLLSIVGRSGTGKTVLLEKIIPALRKRGLKVGVIKHDAHRFDIDIPGKDTWRMAQAGADAVAISSPEKMAVIKKVENEMSLEVVASYLEGVDLILTEGYKSAALPKIEVHRAALGLGLLATREEGLLAVASDEEIPGIGVPVFDLEDAESIAEFILGTISSLQKPPPSLTRI